MSNDRLVADEQELTAMALNNSQSSIQSGSIAAIIANPKSVQRRTNAKPLFGSHAANFHALGRFGSFVTRECAKASVHGFS